MDDKKDVIKLARDRGHTHLYEIFQNPEVFKNIDKILLIHFSDKYSVEYIKDQVYSNIPESLKGKILISTYAAEARWWWEYFRSSVITQSIVTERLEQTV